MMRRLRFACLVGLVAAAAAVPAWADEDAPADKKDKIPPPAKAPAPPPAHHGPPVAGAPAAPAVNPCVRTITCVEYVRENYTTTRTAYRYECRTENYTAHRCEFVPETKTRQVTCYRHVQEMVNEVRTVCERVPVVEERTVCKPVWTTVTETVMVCKTVDRGHYECREVYSHMKALQNRMHSFRHRHDCCEPCPPSNCRTVKVWVPCKVTIQCPETRCRRVCTMVQHKCQVTVCKMVPKQVTVQVCRTRCIPETRTETYTCCVARMVPYQACRQVRVCVPYQETVTCCRMVPRTVTREVPVAVANACCGDVCCEAPRCHRRFSFGRHGRGHGHGGCDNGCH